MEIDRQYLTETPAGLVSINSINPTQVPGGRTPLVGRPTLQAAMFQGINQRVVQQKVRGSIGRQA